MRILKDLFGKEIRLTEERLEHILLHPEMVEMIDKIEDTLINPEFIIESIQDESVLLYNKFYITKCFGGKFLCVIVKENENNIFIVTSFLMSKLPKGEIIWQRN